MQNYENIPQYVKENAPFCCWRYQTKNGKVTKEPYNPVSGYHANVSKPRTFCNYTTAVSASEKYDGIGINVGNRIIAIDLDHCVEDGKPLPWAVEITVRFQGAYIEFSPSGTGLRILCMVQDGFTYDTGAFHIKKGSVEVYAAGVTKHFVTLTGNIYQAGDVVELPSAISWLLNTHMRRKNPVMPTAIQERESYLDDDSALAKAMVAKNADKFNKLWNGDISDYPSHSEADSALCSMLAFYCNGSIEQIDRLFRKSALMRDKWDSRRSDSTYGNITIQRAVSGMTKFYSPIAVGSAVEDFDDSMPKLQAMRPEETSFYPWTDIGAGRLLADFYKDTLRFVPERKMWFCYEKGIWSSDVGGLKVMKCCMELADLLYVYALNIKDEHKRKGYIDYVRRWQTHGCRVNILKDAQVHHPISASQFDTDPYIFNCENGTLHLDTGDFTEHRSEDKLTKITSVKYTPAAVCERWELFIREITSGDTERARFLQKILGYGLSGDTRHECMTILYGATTRNGKGTLCESVLKVYGSYGCTARPETISLKTGNNSSQPTEDIARLAGVRFVNISEPGKGLVLNAAQVKSMTGNDTINARFLHENSFDFIPQFKLYINTNYLPVINDITVFTSGRILIIPFERHFGETEQDKSLKREFAKPEVQSAILNWLIRGYEMLRKEGLTIPQSVKAATSQYQHDSDKMRLFMEECMEQAETAEERTTDVYQRYKCWCGENGQFAENMKNFKQALIAVATVQRKRPRTGGEKTTMVIGYKLISDFL
jgi:putative DNA primase/helicase